MYRNRFFADENSLSSGESSDDEQQHTNSPIKKLDIKLYIDSSDDELNVKRICWNDKQWCSTFNKQNSNNLNILRQKFRRCLKQDFFEKQINVYRENPDYDEDSTTDEDENIGENVLSIKDKQENNNDDFSNQSDDEIIDDSSASSSQIYVKFLKNRTTTQNKVSRGNRKKPKINIEQVVIIDKNEETNEKLIVKKLNEIVSIRGKRGINYQNQFDCLNTF
ncbi:unnamed protein product, partial [Rotaria sp. Silwood2]